MIGKNSRWKFKVYAFLSVGASVLVSALVFLNICAAGVRLAYFTAHPRKGFTGVPTVLVAVAISTIAYLGYFFAKASIGWFVVFYFASAVVMTSDLRFRKI
jgi:phosphatidylserine synthase